jgi:DNA-binding HxlR family transcriptional regulator
VSIRRDVDGDGDVSPSLLDALELLTAGAHAAVLRSIAGGAKFMPSIRAATGFAIDEASLIEVLKQLAQCGAISRLVHAGPPLRVEYELTDSGLRLDSLIVSAREWIERWT